MKRENNKLFDFARSADFEPCEIVVEEVEKATTAQDSLIKVVYTIDERTGLPVGDLNYLVSDKANPEVKEFILANLMQDVSVAKNVVSKYNMSDDDVLALSMNKDESLDSYINRLNESISRDMWLMQQYKLDVQSKSAESSVPAE